MHCDAYLPSNQTTNRVAYKFSRLNITLLFYRAELIRIPNEEVKAEKLNYFLRVIKRCVKIMISN